MYTSTGPFTNEVVGVATDPSRVAMEEEGTHHGHHPFLSEVEEEAAPTPTNREEVAINNNSSSTHMATAGVVVTYVGEVNNNRGADTNSNR